MDDQLLPWLRTQIAEAERDAHGAALVLQQAYSVSPEDARRWWVDDANGCVVVLSGPRPDRQPVAFAPDGGYLNDVGEHMVRNDPRAVLAQCEAHTRILDLVDLYFNDDGEPSFLGGYGEAYWDVVRLLALAYQHNPGYQEAWRP